jgi:hypothetical protein
MSRSYQQRALFEAPPVEPAAPVGRLRKCASCANLTVPERKEMAAAGLWQCKLDGIATYRSTHVAGGGLRECEKGLRDANE